MPLPIGMLGYRFMGRAHVNAIDDVDVFDDLGPNHLHDEPSIVALEASDERGDRLTVT